MNKNNNDHSNIIKYVFITPHTHWDREWYLPFQEFRYKLVKLIDELLGILNKQDYYFTFDGQTIVIEDYLEIRPKKKEELFKQIREGKVRVGPWYLLPDIWLVGQESLIRNLEYSYDLAKEYDIPLMEIGYLPDMFGHSRAIPQIIGDLTNFSVLVVWRGVPPDITTVPFHWKSNTSAKTSMLTVYLPFGYGNAASLPEEVEKLSDEIKNLVNQLQPFSPIPVYLLHHGTDHQFPNVKVASSLQQVHIEGMEISLGVLDDYVKKFQQIINEENYTPTEYAGELRSSARAHLLQDTYSARMWIKQWNQKVEDILTHYAEPLNAYTWYYLKKEYPTSFLSQAWKWHLRNQPHDSICGCSVDQTHNEMKFRYSFAESIAKGTIDEAIGALEANTEPSADNSLLVFNPTNCVNLPIYFDIKSPVKEPIRKLITYDGTEYEVQAIYSSTDKVWEMTAGATRLKALMKMLPGRQIMNLYINEVTFFDGETPETCEVHLLVGNKPVGDLENGSLRKNLLEKIDSKKYKNFHILLTRELEQTYATLVPLKPYAFSIFTPSSEPVTSQSNKKLSFSKNSVSNDYYKITFTKDGSLDLLDKINNIKYSRLHQFENLGDRGDEYTFGRLGPEFIKVNDVKRVITASGSLFCEIEQTLTLSVFQEINSTGEKREGKTKIPVNTIFRFYRDLSRIDIKTSLTNTAKDHRLRICFDLPFKSQYTFTSTHFGFIKRFGDPMGDETYIERPSGIQPQKRFIRVEDETTQAAFTLMNQGLPEVELVNGTRIAMTLIRSIGWLSRSGIPERPEHAGPNYATPGAQELNESYIFDYSFFSHSKEVPFFRSADHSETFSLIPKAIFFKEAISSDDVLQPLIQVSDPNIRISSLRVRDNKIQVTVFNMSSETITTKIRLPTNFTVLTQVKIDGSIKEETKSLENLVELSFNPHEIKMCNLE